MSRIREQWWRFTDWMDYRWVHLHARLIRPGGLAHHDRHPVLFYAGFVPLTTWLTHPFWGVESVRRHVISWRQDRELQELLDNPPES